jgi:UDPglucose 6-dehydrogenase
MLEERLRRQAPAGDGVELAWNPEFLREAFAVEDTLRPDRLVFGTHSSRALEILEQVYAMPLSENTPVVRCIATAELIKVGQRLPRDQDQLHQRDGPDVPSSGR